MTTDTLAIPSEPPEGSVVLDAHGDAWQHIPSDRPSERWRSPSRNVTYAWSDLLVDHGPLRLLHNPEADDERRARLVTDTNMAFQPGPDAATQSPSKKTEQRPGQAAWNVLAALRPDLAHVLNGSSLDTWDHDERLDDLLRVLRISHLSDDYYEERDSTGALTYLRIGPPGNCYEVGTPRAHDTGETPQS